MGVCFPLARVVSKVVSSCFSLKTSPILYMMFLSLVLDVIFNAFSGVMMISSGGAVDRGWVEINLAHLEAAGPPVQESGQATA